MILPNEDLRNLCIKNDWFTCGSNEQYEKLFESNRLGASIHDITIIIWLCTDDVPMFQIREELEKAIKEREDEQ